MGIRFKPKNKLIEEHENEGAVICELANDGSAVRSKSLEIGDELLSINDVSIRNIPFNEVMQYLFDTSGRIDLLFRRSPTQDSKQRDLDWSLIRTTIKKPMGIVFETMTDENDPVNQKACYIREITSQGFAAQSGILQLGDELLSVDGIATVDFTFNETMDLIIESDTDSVDLLFRRRN